MMYLSHTTVAQEATATMFMRATGGVEEAPAFTLAVLSSRIQTKNSLNFGARGGTASVRTSMGTSACQCCLSEEWQG